MMTASATLYMSRHKPLASECADGTFLLSMLLMDRIGVHQVEPWFVTWSGDDARNFYHDHRHELVPGQPVHITANHIRSHSSGRGSIAEIHANVVLAYLAPVARSNTNQPTNAMEHA